MTEAERIIKLLPYKRPFLFVDKLSRIDENGIEGNYQLKKDEFFFQGHFPGSPVTPGVIIIEVMAQIGLVCLGIHLAKKKISVDEELVPVFSSTSVDFFTPVFPGDTLGVSSQKIYFRFNKLKCKVECHNIATSKLVCRGEFSGMVINKNQIGK